MSNGDTAKKPSESSGFSSQGLSADCFSPTSRPHISKIDLSSVKRILIVRLRSIGDTVLVTPTLTALRRAFPDAQIDILLEDWVAPLLDDFEAVDNVISVGKGAAERLKTALALRKTGYDVAINMHGGTTATFFTFATGARHRIGFADYQYPFLYTDLLSSSADFWGRKPTHSAEQQLALIGFIGIPVDDPPKTSLAVTEKALTQINGKLTTETQTRRESKAETRPVGSVSQQKFVLIHPVAAFAEKQWATEKFASIAEFLAEKGLQAVAVATKSESHILDALKTASKVSIITFNDLTLPEITALASRASLFVGNDSGIAHIASAVRTPSVVIFGSSNIDHWRPWTDAPNEIVYSNKPCNHYKGETNKGLPDPKCIECVDVAMVIDAIDQVF